MTIKTVHDLMTTALTYVLDFEEKIGKAAPEMAKASSSPDLKDAFEKTGTKCKHYGSAIENVFKAFDAPVKRNENHIALAMIREVEGMVKETEAGPVRDAALIVAANQQQLFRVASYGSLLSYAELLDNKNAVSEMTAALHDCKEGDKKFTAIAENSVNRLAAKAA